MMINLNIFRSLESLSSTAVGIVLRPLKAAVELWVNQMIVAETQALLLWEPLPSGSALIDYWRQRLGKAERLILETLTEVYPAALSKEEVATKAGYEPNGGVFNNALGRLRTA
jgi:hypothetical protein